MISLTLLINYCLYLYSGINNHQNNLVMDNYDRVSEVFNDLSNSDKVQVNNLFCEQVNYADDNIYSNDEEFFEIFYSRVSPMQAIKDAHHGSYEYNDDYVQFNGQGSLNSSDYPEEFMDVNLIIQDIIESPEVYSDFIDLDFLDEDEEE
jgi:hypothetical protein